MKKTLGLLIAMATCVSCSNLKSAEPLSATLSQAGDEVTVFIGEPVTYRCESRDNIVARYGSLSDGSLDFVKITFADGKEQTLPQVISASGARYSDGVLEWWTKGDSACFESCDSTIQHCDYIAIQ